MMTKELSEELAEELETEAREDLGQEEEIQPTPTELEAIEMGWSDKDTFVGKGGDPEKHVSPHEFVRWGKHVKATNERLAQMERKTDERITNLNRLHDAQQASKISELQALQRQAVEDADTGKYDALQKQISDVAAETVPQTTGKDPAVVAWEAKNPWINDPASQKAAVAQGIWNQFAASNQNATHQMALDHVDAEITKLYPAETPPTNSRRNQPSMTETSRPGKRGKTRELSMSDLSREEMGEYDNVGHMFMDKDGKPSQKVFLKAVQDGRAK